MRRRLSLACALLMAAPVAVAASAGGGFRPGRRRASDHAPRDPAPSRRAGAGPARPGAADRPERDRAAAAERVSGRLHPAARPLAADGESRRHGAPVRSLQPEHAQGRPADLRGLLRRAVGDFRHRDRAALDAGAGRHPDRRARQPRRLRRYRAAAVQPDPAAQHLADQGRHRLPAARPRAALHPGLQLQPHEAEESALPVRRCRQGPDAQRGRLRHPGGVSRLPHPQCVGALRFRLGPVRHPTLHDRLQGLPVPGQSARRAPVRHPRQQSLAVQSRLVPPPRQGRQQRPERGQRGPAQRRRLRREPLPAGLPDSRPDVAGDRRPQPQPRRRADRRQRLPRASGRDRGCGAARVRCDLLRPQLRRPHRPDQPDAHPATTRSDRTRTRC